MNFVVTSVRGGERAFNIKSLHFKIFCLFFRSTSSRTRPDTLNKLNLLPYPSLFLVQHHT